MPDSPATAITLAIAVMGVLIAIGSIVSSRQVSDKSIRSSEAMALKQMTQAQGAELHAEMATMRISLQRCEDDRAADVAQRKADAARHAADEEQRRIDDERHRQDETRHAIDQGEITRSRQDLAMVQNDLNDLRRKLRRMADAAKVFGEDSGASEIEENEEHP